jgi:myo-inositol-1(or 4)-monophosphatase
VADPLPPQFLATAVEAVIRAGDVQMARFGGDLRVDKKGAIDLVTEIDLEVERAFRAMIAGRFPDHAVLGEEFESEGERETIARHCWVIDPIDGTTNYAHGLPIFCASLALEIDGEPCVGAVYDPTRRELFTAERGAGAWLNGAPLRVSPASTLIDALLVTGFHYNVQRDPDELIGLFAEFVTRAQAVRRLGSAALDLCYVAAGRFDGMLTSRACRSVDAAAGQLVARQAGAELAFESSGLDVSLDLEARYHVAAGLDAQLLATVLEAQEHAERAPEAGA